MDLRHFILFIIPAVMIFACDVTEQPDVAGPSLYEMSNKSSTHWASFENSMAEKGRGGMENQGAKGRAFERLEPGEVKTLLNVEGSGVIRRMWITIFQKDPTTLRSLKLQMYWDGSERPAVSVPFGDFFGSILGKNSAFENALFSNPEGRSYNFYIPMPFRKGAKIELVNEADYQVSHVFYDINFTKEAVSENALYFHAWWMHENPTKLGEDFTILPKLPGKGKYLGAHIGVIDDSRYQKNWWGEGEIKIFLDGDSEYPSLVGTGTEDYIGTGWGQGQYFHQFQGCTISEWPYFGFYRYHIPDPVYFQKDIRVSLQIIGGTSDRAQLIEMKNSGVPMIPVSIDAFEGPVFKDFVRLLEMDPIPAIDDPTLPEGHMNYYRIANVSAVVFFYLNSPVNPLVQIESAEDRVIKVTSD